MDAPNMDANFFKACCFFSYNEHQYLGTQHRNHQAEAQQHAETELTKQIFPELTDKKIKLHFKKKMFQ